MGRCSPDPRVVTLHGFAQARICAGNRVGKTALGQAIGTRHRSLSLHIQAAWALVLTGLTYVAFGPFTRHPSRNLLPSQSDFSWRSVGQEIADHLRFRRPVESEAWSYSVLQRLAFIAVIFGLFPLEIWTGLAMSPAFVSAFPSVATLLGGQQSARTLHFLVTVLLVLFVLVHIAMVCLAGFGQRVRAMVTGRAAPPRERL